MHMEEEGTVLPGRRHIILMDATHAAQDASIADQKWGDALLGAEMMQMVYEQVYQEVWLTPVCVTSPGGRCHGRLADVKPGGSHMYKLAKAIMYIVYVHVTFSSSHKHLHACTCPPAYLHVPTRDWSPYLHAAPCVTGVCCAPDIADPGPAVCQSGQGGGTSGQRQGRGGRGQEGAQGETFCPCCESAFVPPMRLRVCSVGALASRATPYCTTRAATFNCTFVCLDFFSGGGCIKSSLLLKVVNVTSSIEIYRMFNVRVL